jgi:hypothetical protein
MIFNKNEGRRVPAAGNSGTRIFYNSYKEELKRR